MKKILLILGLIAGSVSFTRAQSLPKIIVKAGVNFASISESGNGASSSSATTGYHVGLVADFGLGNQLSLQPGILYTTKGGKSDQSSTISGTTTYAIRITQDLTLNYIEIPVNVLYHIPVSGGKIFVGGGPYIALGISGKASATLTQTNGSNTQTQSQNQNITYGNGYSDIKNPDYGINFLAGFKLEKGLSISAGYGLGLANLSNQSGLTSKNNVLSISVGFSIL